MEIAILLATYNSGSRIIIQIESILQQTYKNWILYIHDDGSTDDTLSIIKAYQSKDKRILLLEDTQKKRGAKNSFMWMLEHVNSMYYMFCDHDDLWLPHKIEESFFAIQNIEKTNPYRPICIHTDLAVCDENYNVTAKSLWTLSKVKPKILENIQYLKLFNCVTGCTLIFNEYAKKAAFPFNKNAPMHDWWIAYCTLKNNGILSHINKSTILYCQHGLNEIGAINVNFSFFVSKIKKIKLVYQKNKELYLFLKEIDNTTLWEFFKIKIHYELIRLL